MVRRHPWGQAAPPAEPQPSRVSRRLRGEVALGQQEAASAARQELAEEEAEENEGGRAGQRTASAGKRGTSRRQLTLEELQRGTEYHAPFTLWSIGGRGTSVGI